MPDANFNDNLNLPCGGSTYVKLQKAGDKIKFRIAGTPKYEVKHFNIDGRGVKLCTKYNSPDPKNSKCIYCDQYQKLIDSGDKKAADLINPSTIFYYPVMQFSNDVNDKKGGTAVVFQFTAKSIHWTIAGYSKEGVDVLSCNWVVERLEENKKVSYKVLRLDGTVLSEEQNEALERAKKMKLLATNKSGSVQVEHEANESLVDSES